MIVETLIIGVTVVTVYSLKLSQYVLDREERLAQEKKPPKPFSLRKFHQGMDCPWCKRHYLGNNPAPALSRSKCPKSGCAINKKIHWHTKCNICLVEWIEATVNN